LSKEKNMTTTIEIDDRFVQLLARLGEKSADGYYNPYTMFNWAEHIDPHQYWMSPELVSVHGTEIGATLDQDTIYALSRWESINFYSLNVHGIRDLIIEVVRRIHTTGFETPSEFFHHFIGEENEHMWFFAEFCLRYGGKIYSSPAVKLSESGDPEVENFLVFARILIFEEIVDHYNMRMGSDESLHETIRQVNSVHHQDESRHIAFGRELVKHLFNELEPRLDTSTRSDIEIYLKRYLSYSIQSLYNPQVYKDAGLADPLDVRRKVMADPARRQAERKVLRKPLAFLTRTGILADAQLGASA
jgi:hypothetical protein